MKRRETATAIDNAAAQWAARLDRGPLTPDQQAELNAWLAADTRHFGAFARAEAVLALSERARALDYKILSASAPRPALTRRHMIGGGAAALAASLLAAVVLKGSGDRAALQTSKGEIRRVTLSDGSAMTLDTASSARSAFEPSVRRIDLDSGEAFFEVAKDRTRPFHVVAGHTRVTAIGTSFSVARLPGGDVRVVVREGIVAIDHPGTAGSIRLGANAMLVAGTPAPGKPPAVVSVSPQELNRSLAWRDGMLAFEARTLRDAASDFARYSDVRITIDDPELADRTVSGWFTASDPRGFARAAALSLGARTIDSEDAIHIVS